MNKSPETGGENYLRRSVLMFGATMLCVIGALTIAAEGDDTDRIDAAMVSADNFIEGDFAPDTIGFENSGYATLVGFPEDLEDTDPNHLTVPFLGWGLTTLNDISITASNGQVTTVNAGQCRDFELQPEEDTTGVQVFTDYRYPQLVSVENADRETSELEVCSVGTSDVRVAVGLSEKPAEDPDISGIHWQYPLPSDLDQEGQSFAPDGGWATRPEIRDQLNDEMSQSQPEFLETAEPIRGLKFNFFQVGYGDYIDINDDDLRQLILNTFQQIQEARDSPYRTAVLQMLNDSGGEFNEEIINVSVLESFFVCFERNSHDIIEIPSDDNIEDIRCGDYVGNTRVLEETEPQGPSVFSLRVSSPYASDNGIPTTPEEANIDYAIINQELQDVFVHEFLHALIIMANDGGYLDAERHPIRNSHGYLISPIQYAPDTIIDPLTGDPLEAITS